MYQIHRNNFVLTTGGMFLVPRGQLYIVLIFLGFINASNVGNMYRIQNLADREARLFFAQARKVEREEIVDEIQAKAIADAEAARAAAEAVAEDVERESGESRSPTLVPQPKRGR